MAASGQYGEGSSNAWHLQADCICLDPLTPRGCLTHSPPRRVVIALRMGPGQGGRQLRQAWRLVPGASTIFRDPLSTTGADPDHSTDEERFITFGVSVSGRLLIVAHTDSDDTIRIISARPVTAGE